MLRERSDAGDRNRGVHEGFGRLLRIPANAGEHGSESPLVEKLRLGTGFEVIRLRADSQLEVAVLQVGGGVRVPDGISMRPGPTRRICFPSEMAAAVVGSADSKF